MRRSGGITAFGIIFIILGSLMLIGGIFSFFRLLTPFGLMFNILSILVAIGWIIGGIGVLGLRNWARNLVIILACIGLLVTLYNFLQYLIPSIAIFPVSVFPGLAVAGLVIYIIATLIGLAYYIFIIYFFNRQFIKEQFSGMGQIDEPSGPVVIMEEPTKQPIQKHGPRVGPQKEKKAAWLILKGGPEGTREFSLDEYEVKIGRSESNDIVLKDPTVTGEHAKVFLDLGKWYVQDVGSLNGTFLNGQKVLKHDLMDNDKIKVGNSLLVFRQT